MKNLFDNLQVFSEVYFRKRSSSEKREVKKALRKNRRGTNWKQTAPRKGMKRVKVAPNRYVRIYLTPNERQIKKVVGRSLGRASYLRK